MVCLQQSAMPIIDGLRLVEDAALKKATFWRSWHVFDRIAAKYEQQARVLTATRSYILWLAARVGPHGKGLANL